MWQKQHFIIWRCSNAHFYNRWDPANNIQQVCHFNINRNTCLCVVHSLFSLALLIGFAYLWMLLEIFQTGKNSQATTALLHPELLLIPHWNSTHVKWLWWSMRDHRNNIFSLCRQLCKYSTQWWLLAVCVLHWCSVCCARTSRGQSVLGICVRCVTWLKEGTRSISAYVSVVVLLSHATLDLSSLPAGLNAYIHAETVRWRFLQE